MMEVGENVPGLGKKKVVNYRGCGRGYQVSKTLKVREADIGCYCYR